MADQKPWQKKEEELERKLVEMRQKEEEDKYKILARQLNLPYSDLKSIPIDADVLSVLSEEEARSANIAVIFKNDRTTKRAEIFEIGAIEIKEGELDRLEKELSNTSDLKGRLQKVSTTGLLELLVAGALKTEASDIHLEPEQKSARLRYRIDGLLHDIAVIDRHPYETALDRIKVLSKMKLNTRGVSQDGRFTIRQKSVSMEVRVSVLPGEFGETIVMRLLDPRTIKKDIEELGRS